MGERLNIFNKQEQLLGVKDRKDIHRDGDWHETFHCWFYEVKSNGIDLYFQKRADDKKDFPGLYDITAAGHVGAEENLWSGGLREIEEEIGVKLDATHLISAGTFKESLTIGELNDNEICRIFLFSCEEEQTFQIGEEVTDVVKVDLLQLNQLLEGANEEIVSSSLLTGECRHLSIQNLVPHERAYYSYIIRSVAGNVEKL
ncbi:NUDIX domain-containing protein [Halobacillus sp. BBL2006]|uniref:NUDIX hydrolase n=1 Tax=Halobacillus sp. BBL2006 TaxID=1543706 RepID=UPI0005419EC6|nr:NUDIX domain-containing protein [Halobacillus sp. BBL2006]KHE68535.1 hypothetical protein LD39_14455 [Halobacillus sp. BBL2006]